MISVTAPTNWYSILGTGEFVQVNVFAEGDFDTQVSIYSGESCDTLTCIEANDDSPFPGPRSTISVLLEAEVPYYILVHGYNNAAGEYSLEIKELERATNDECVTGTPMTLGTPESGSTLAATVDDDLPYCGL